MWNSFHSIGCNGDKHGFALIEGWRRGVRAFRRVTRVLRSESSQFSGESLVGRSGRVGTFASLISGSRLGQSVLTLFGPEAVGCNGGLAEDVSPRLRMTRRLELITVI